jgi:riboflavin kinase/FMN adenylyltransferase
MAAIRRGHFACLQEERSPVQLFTDLRALEREQPTVVTIGTFDGLHRGHQYLIRQAVERSRYLEHKSLVLTFDPRPQVVLRPGSQQLTDGSEKARLAAALGPTSIVALPFTRELSQVPPGEFLVSLLEHVNMSEIWIGADFAFGHNREGNVDFLIRAGQHSGFAVHVVSRQALDGRPLSSTAIRELVSAGKVDEAATLLGHFFRVSGNVVEGFGRGKDLGFPTANISYDAIQQLPGTGVYAAYAALDDQLLQAAVSVGYNPTFAGERITVEAYILDYSGDLEGKRVGIDFVSRLRGEKAFDRVEDLVAAMHKDVDRAREILATAEQPGEMVL